MSQRDFRNAAVRQERCAACDLLVLKLGHAHHAIPERSLRDLFPDRPELVWDIRNALLLCTGHHMRHHLRFELVPLESLPRDVHDFAAELGITWLLRRLYTRPAPVVDRKAPDLGVCAHCESDDVEGAGRVGSDWRLRCRACGARWLGIRRRAA